MPIEVHAEIVYVGVLTSPYFQQFKVVFYSRLCAPFCKPRSTISYEYSLNHESHKGEEIAFWKYIWNGERYPRYALPVSQDSSQDEHPSFSFIITRRVSFVRSESSELSFAVLLHFVENNFCVEVP